MVRRSIRLAGPDEASTTALAARFDRIRSELGVPAEFPPAVVSAAREAATGPDFPRDDLTDVPFVTVDPPGSTDLDQAMCLSRRADGGYHVDYAIADVPSFLPPGGPVAAEALRRGQTLYAPDRRTPLHPEVLSEDAASLLPGVDRRAFVWRFDLDPAGEVTSADVVRALVRSRRRLDYQSVQNAADNPDETDVARQAVLLREIGTLRQGLERDRGGASLPLPEQEVTAEKGSYRVTLRPGLPAEDWNAQISLLTGMAAAQIMLEARIGILRTLPSPGERLLAQFARQVRALGVTWPDGQSYGAFLAGLDRSRSDQLAVMHEAGALFRGAGYTPMDGTVPEVITHAAVAAPYAHVTAPLRRLVDRFGLVVCHAVRAGLPIPDWARAGLPLLPGAMVASDRLASALEHRCVDTVEAAVLCDVVGQEFDAVTVDLNHNGGGKVQLIEPAVLASCTGPLELGVPVRVRLIEADLDAAKVTFAPVPGRTSSGG